MIVGDTEFEFALLGPQDDRLAVQPAHHVEGRLGLAAQGQFQEVGLDARLDGFAQLGLNGEKAVRRAEAGQPLVRPLVVVIFDPELDALAGGLKALELSADEKVLPDRGPEALDLPEGHRVVRAGLDMGHPVLPELGLETAGAAPGGVLAPVVGEHLPRRLELGDGHAIHLDDRLGRGAAEEIRSDHVTGVVIQKGYEVGIAPTQPESEDVTLPHLVGRSPLKEARAGQVFGPLPGRGRHQFGFLQPLPHGAGTGRQQEPPAQELRDALDAKGGVLLFEGHDLLVDGRRKLLDAMAAIGAVFQGVLAASLIPFHPEEKTLLVYPEFTAEQLVTIVALQIQFNGFEPQLRRIAAARAAGFFIARPPHGGFYSLFLR